jgi:hypothetical protein
MKELILFSFVIIFISCQNQTLQSSTLELKPDSQAQAVSLAADSFEALACASEELQEQSLDVVQELANSENPGFYYRAPILRSELLSGSELDQLVCTSGTTEFNDEPQVATDILASELSTPTSETATEEASWAILTEKWELEQQIVSCQEQSLQSENPACEDTTFSTEEGELLSSHFENSAVVL